MMRPLLRWVEAHEPLPPAHTALREPNGLVAAGRDLSADRLLEAYRGGLFPWYSEGQPVLWWSPDPRMVLELARFKASRSLVKTLRRIRREGQWQISLNQRFDQVIEACSAPRPGLASGTWITPEIRHAYGELHRRGHAHSVEIQDEDKRLLGGLYGVSIGRMFYGESMFAWAPDASKIALYALVDVLLAQGFRVIDCQQNTRHLASLGATEVPRVKFLSDVSELSVLPSPDWASVVIDFPDA